jgi:hypothetical protein
MMAMTPLVARAMHRGWQRMGGASATAVAVAVAEGSRLDDIAGFDLWPMQMVVLWACEIGVGPVSSSDGVYGLRRALVMAGAASQVVSPWGGPRRCDRANLKVMRQPRHAHPFCWATFIPVSDWRPPDEACFHKESRSHDSIPLHRGSHRESYRLPAT